MSIELPLISRGIARMTIRESSHFWVPLVEMAFFMCFLNDCFWFCKAIKDPNAGPNAPRIMVMK